MTENYTAKEVAYYITIIVWAITFLGAAIYLGWKLLDFNLGDGVLYAFVLATILIVTNSLK